MARRITGSVASGQFIRFPGRTTNSKVRELRGWVSYTENTSAATTDTETLPNGEQDTVIGDVPIPTISLTLNFQSHNKDHAWLSEVSEASKNVEFGQFERVLDTPATAATAAINETTGAVTFGGTGTPQHAVVGAVGDAIQIGTKDYFILDIQPATGKTEISSSLHENMVFVDVGDFGLSAAVAAGSYKIVSPELTSGTVAVKTTQAPAWGDTPADSNGRRTGTVTLAPSVRPSGFNSPTAKRPAFATS